MSMQSFFCFVLFCFLTFIYSCGGLLRGMLSFLYALIIFTQLHIHTWKLPSKITVWSVGHRAVGFKGLAKGHLSSIEGGTIAAFHFPNSVLSCWRPSTHKTTLLTFRPPLPQAWGEPAHRKALGRFICRLVGLSVINSLLLLKTIIKCSDSHSFFLLYAMDICTNFKPIHLIIIEVLQTGFKWWTTKQTNQVLAWPMTA